MATALWLEPKLNATFAAMAEHHETILPTRSRPRYANTTPDSLISRAARIGPTPPSRSSA